MRGVHSCLRCLVARLLPQVQRHPVCAGQPGLLPKLPAQRTVRLPALSDTLQINNGIMPRTRCTIDGLAAASFWIAIKADGSRACLPSRALLERACSIRAAVLSAVELVRV